MRRGLMLRSRSLVSLRLGITRLAKLLITTSASTTSRSNNSLPASELRSSVMSRLLQLASFHSGAHSNQRSLPVGAHV